MEGEGGSESVGAAGSAINGSVAGDSGGSAKRVIEYSTPNAAEVMIKPEPPAEISGSDKPLVGTETVATAMLITACNPIMQPMPRARSLAKTSRCERMICQ